MRDKEHKKEYDRAYAEDNKERIRARYKVYYAKVRDKKLQANREWMEKNKEYRSEYSRKRDLAKSYGITVERYNEMFNEQEGNCAICGLNQENFTKRLYVDHNHDTNEVRSLLCVNCNMLIGHAMEDIGTLEESIKYLKKWNTPKKN